MIGYINNHATKKLEEWKEGSVIFGISIFSIEDVLKEKLQDPICVYFFENKNDTYDFRREWLNRRVSDHVLEYFTESEYEFYNQELEIWQNLLEVCKTYKIDVPRVNSYVVLNGQAEPLSSL